MDFLQHVMICTKIGHNENRFPWYKEYILHYKARNEFGIWMQSLCDMGDPASYKATVNI